MTSVETIRITNPPYLLEKQPNLLCYNLYLPLYPTGSGHKCTLQTVNVSPKDLYLEHQVIDPRIPTLTVRDNRTEPGCQLRVYVATPKSNDSDILKRDNFQLKMYQVIPLDCKIDLDRSTLNMHGHDFLVARLRFSSAHSATSTKFARTLVHPHPEEMEVPVYKPGFSCKKCDAVLVPPEAVEQVIRAPSSPWTDLLKNVTCVAPEEYLGTEADPAFNVGHVVPKPTQCFVGEAVLAFHPDAILHESVVIKPPHQGDATTVSDNSNEYRSSGPNLALRDAIFCGQCKHWVGDVACLAEDTESSSNRPDEVRLFKCAVKVPGRDAKTDPFSKYTVDSLLGSFIMGASKIRDCNRFVLFSVDDEEGTSTSGNKAEARAQLIVMNNENWMQTNNKPSHPVIKVMYTDTDDRDNEDVVKWAEEHGAEKVVLQHEQYTEIMNNLVDGTLSLPLSLQSFKDYKVGYLHW